MAQNETIADNKVFWSLSDMCNEGRFSYNRLRQSIISHYGGNSLNIPQDKYGRWRIPHEVKSKIYNELEKENVELNKFWTVTRMVKDGKFSYEQIQNAILQHYGERSLIPKNGSGHWLIPSDVKEEIYRQLGYADARIDNDSAQEDADNTMTLRDMANEKNYSYTKMRIAIIKYYGSINRIPKNQYGSWQIPSNVRKEVYASLDIENAENKKANSSTEVCCNMSNKNANTNSEETWTVSQMARESGYSYHVLRNAVLQYYKGSRNVPKLSSTYWMIPADVRDKIIDELREADAKAKACDVPNTAQNESDQHTGSEDAATPERECARAAEFKRKNKNHKTVAAIACAAAAWLIVRAFRMRK